MGKTTRTLSSTRVGTKSLRRRAGTKTRSTRTNRRRINKRNLKNKEEQKLVKVQIFQINY